MRVLLINPQGSWVSYEGALGAGDRDFGDFLGIRYIAAVAQDRGHDAEILDAQLENLASRAGGWRAFGVRT